MYPSDSKESSCQSHDMLHPACPKKHLMYTRPFPFLGLGSGDETILYSLKLSKVESFIDFIGQSKTTMIFSRKFQVHNRCKVWLEAWP